MLILTRRIGESIIINDDIKITLIGFKSASNISIGIEAPKETSVHREEVYERIKKEKGYANKIEK